MFGPSSDGERSPGGIRRISPSGTATDGDPLPVPCPSASSADEARGRPLGLVSGTVPEGLPLILGERSSYRERPGRRRERYMGVAGSVGVHLAILASFLVSFDFRRDPPPVTRTLNTFDVSFVSGDDGHDAPIPKAAPPKAEEVAEETKLEPKPAVEPQPRPEEPKPSTAPETSERPPSDAPTQPTEGAGAPGGRTIWTPPAPTPGASKIDAQRDEARDEVRVELPKVDIPKGASAPILMSYDQGRFSDAASVSEASRLLNTGTIAMSVTVDEKGVVSDCVVTTTSGSPMLDGRACALVRSYLYRPAQDEKGRPHMAIVPEVLEWARDGRFKEAPADAVAPGTAPATAGGDAPPIRRAPVTAPSPIAPRVRR